MSPLKRQQPTLHPLIKPQIRSVENSLDTCSVQDESVRSRRPARLTPASRIRRLEGMETSASPLVNTLCARLGVAYGGWDTMSPLPAGVGRGTQLVFHIDDGSGARAEPPQHGTGIVRQAHVFADRTEVYDGETLLARFDDLTAVNLFVR